MTRRPIEMEQVVSRTKEAALTYVAAWNENDEAERRRLIERCRSAGCTIQAPNAQIAGRDDVLAAIRAFRVSRPDDRAVLTTEIDCHHHVFRFAGHVMRPDGTTYSEVLDVGEVDAEGRITRVLTFTGTLPP